MSRCPYTTPARWIETSSTQIPRHLARTFYALITRLLSRHHEQQHRTQAVDGCPWGMARVVADYHTNGGSPLSVVNANLTGVLGTSCTSLHWS
jgi:hypothetical protein